MFNIKYEKCNVFKNNFRLIKSNFVYLIQHIVYVTMIICVYYKCYFFVVQQRQVHARHRII